MKIFMLANSFPHEHNKRAGIYNYRLVKQLTNNGNEVTIAFFRVWLPMRKIISSYTYDGIKVFQICLPIILIRNYYLFRLNIFICKIAGYLFLKKELKSTEIIHSVDLCLNGIIAGYWAKILNKPHVAQAIGSDVNYNLRWLVENYNYKKWIKNVRGIITNSKALEKEVRYVFPSFAPLSTIYRGANVSDKNANTRNHDSGVKFLYLGGLVGNQSLEDSRDTKGAGVLTRAWSNVEEELYKLNAVLYFGGPGSSKDLIHNWKNKLKYSQQIEIIGELNPSSIKSTMLGADVIIVPSMQEGLPNVLFESYANARPVIGSTAGGIPEVIIDGETGYLFKRGDADFLGKLLVKCAIGKNENITMGQNAFKRVETYFNADHYGTNILAFYKLIISGAGVNN